MQLYRYTDLPDTLINLQRAYVYTLLRIFRCKSPRFDCESHVKLFIALPRQEPLIIYFPVNVYCLLINLVGFVIGFNCKNFKLGRVRPIHVVIGTPCRYALIRPASPHPPSCPVRQYGWTLPLLFLKLWNVSFKCYLNFYRTFPSHLRHKVYYVIKCLYSWICFLRVQIMYDLITDIFFRCSSSFWSFYTIRHTYVWNYLRFIKLTQSLTCVYI